MMENFLATHLAMVNQRTAYLNKPEESLMELNAVQKRSKTRPQLENGKLRNESIYIQFQQKTPRYC